MRNTYLSARGSKMSASLAPDFLRVNFIALETLLPPLLDTYIRRAI